MQETPRNQWPIPGWNADWQSWQQQFLDLLNDQDATVFANTENLKVIFSSIPNASVIDDAGTAKLVMTGDLVLISRTLNTSITIDSSTDLELQAGYMIGVVLTPGAVGPQDTIFELYSSVEIDPSIQVFGYVDDAYTINWFNGSTLEQGDPSRQMFSFKSTAGGGDNYTVMTTVADTTPGYLSSKLIQGSGVTLTVQNPGANENILISASGTGYWQRVGTVLSPLNSGDSVYITIPDGTNSNAITIIQNDNTNDKHVMHLEQNASSGSAWYNAQAYSIYLTGSGGSNDGFVICANDNLVVGNNVGFGNVSLTNISRTVGSGNSATVISEALSVYSGNTSSKIQMVSDDSNGGDRDSGINIIVDADTGSVDAGYYASSVSNGFGYSGIWADTAGSPNNYIKVQAKTGIPYDENIIIVSDTGISLYGDYIDLNGSLLTDDNNPVGWISDGIALSSSEAEWNNIKTLLGGTEGSIFAAILASSTGMWSIDEGAVVFGSVTGDLDHDVDGLYFDRTNNFLGISNSSPDVGLHVGSNTIGWASTSDDVIISGKLALLGDLFTDRWIQSVGNTLIGINVCGGGNLAHSSGSDGWYNTAIGSGSLLNNSTGYFNIALGYSAGASTTTGSYNIMIGPYANAPNITDDYKLNIGDTIYGDLDSKLIGINNSDAEVGLHLGSGTPINTSSANDGFITNDLEVDEVLYINNHFSVSAQTVSTITVPSSGSCSALSLSNLESANTSEVINITSDSTLSTGFTMYIQGDQGGSESDYNEDGHLIWSPGSITIGHGDRTAGSGQYRAYTRYFFREEDASPMAASELRAESGVAWSDYAYFRVSGSGNSTINATSYIVFTDGYQSGSSYSTGMSFSLNSSEWSAIETACGGEVSLLGAIGQALSGSGVSEPDGQIVYGTGTGVDSEAQLHWDSTNDELTITNNINVTNWYDSNAGSIYLTGSATQGQVIKSDQDFVIGTYKVSAANQLDIICQTATTGNAVFNESCIGSGMQGATLKNYAYAPGGEGGGNAYVILESEVADEGDIDCAIQLKTHETSGTVYQFELKLDTAEFSNLNTVNIGNAELTNIKAATFGTTPDTATWSSGTLTVDFRDQLFQTVSIDGNVTTFTLITPNGMCRGSLRLTNGGISTYTVVAPSSSEFWGDDDGGFSIAGGETVKIICEYFGSGIGWDISVMRTA